MKEKIALFLCFAYLIFMAVKVIEINKSLDILVNDATIDTESIEAYSKHLKVKAFDLSQRVDAFEFHYGWKPCVISWYGDQFHGRKTASGELFDQWGQTCAHNSIKAGTWVLFYNPENARCCWARVTDTGRFNEYGRDFDVSYQVAELLGIREQGVAKIYYKERMKY